LEKAAGLAHNAKSTVEKILGIFSPSKVFIEIGEQVVEGFAIGLSDTGSVDRSAKNLANSAVSSFSTIIASISAEMGQIENFQPTIRPVLDLGQFQGQIRRLPDLIPALSEFAPINGIRTAVSIARMPAPTQSPLDVDQQAGGDGDVVFNQTINAPTELSASEIYKQTRNQITMAKEELDVP
jgi:hypothetical protein